MKICVRCKKTKSLDNFVRRPQPPNYFRPYCLDCTKIYRKEKYQKNKRMERATNKAWARNNKKRRKVYLKKYQEINRTENNTRQRAIWASNPLHKIKKTIRTSLYKALKNKNYTKKSRTHTILGCSWNFLKSYIETQFSRGMSWENHGEWHLDHIVPVSLGETEEEIVSLNHYTNLQPLWKDDNLIKSDNLILNMVSNESLIKYENIIKRIK